MHFFLGAFRANIHDYIYKFLHFQIDFSCKKINLIERGNIRKNFDFENVKTYDSEVRHTLMMEFMGHDQPICATLYYHYYLIHLDSQKNRYARLMFGLKIIKTICYYHILSKDIYPYFSFTITYISLSKYWVCAVHIIYLPMCKDR